MPSGNLVFVGDVHLGSQGPLLDDFLAFLDRVGRTSARLVLIGDLFELWLGRPELEAPHHVAVLERLRELRRQQVVVRYLEGNRDYRIGPSYEGDAVDDVSEVGIDESFGGRRIFAVHGNLVNQADRQYLRWHRASRSAAGWALFNAIPRAPRRSLAASLERRMRRTNLAYKRVFPEPAVRAYAEPYFRAGRDLVVLGHFHTERDLPRTGDAERHILVLPLWSDTRRHLEVTLDGHVQFVDS